MPGALNFKFIAYTAFRLSPFIIVSFFSLSSILNNDLKGIVYLAGLLFACFIAVLSGSMLQRYNVLIPPENMEICNTLTLTDSGKYSNIPLSLVVISYTLSYLMDVAVHYRLIMENISTFIIFVLLIIGELTWNRSYGCASTSLMSAGIVIGLCMGIVWARIIRSTGSVKLQYFSGIGNSQVCSRPSTQTFKCTPKKTA